MSVLLNVGDVCETKVTLIEALKYALASTNLSSVSLSSTRTKTSAHSLDFSGSTTASIHSRTLGSNRRRNVYHPTLICDRRPAHLGPAASFVPKVSTITTLSTGVSHLDGMPTLLKHFMVPVEQLGVSDDGALRMQPPFDQPPTEPVQYAVAITFPLAINRALTGTTRRWTNTRGVGHSVPREEMARWVDMCVEKMMQFTALPREHQKHYIDELLIHLKTQAAQRAQQRAQPSPLRQSTASSQGSGNLARQAMHRQTCVNNGTLMYAQAPSQYVPMVVS